MVAFESSVARLMNMAMRNSSVNNCSAIHFCGNIACVFSVPWSQRFIRPLSLAAGLSSSNTLLILLNKHWSF